MLILTSTQAQVTNVFKVTKKVDDLIQPLNKSSFKTAILYDRVISYAKLNNFNSLDHNTSNVTHFEQSLSELYRSSNKKLFLKVEKIRKKYSFQKNEVEIGIINTSFNRLNYNSKDKKKGGVLLKKEKLVSVKGKKSFLTKNVLIISPLKKIASGKIIIYHFDKNYIFETNPSKKVQHLVVDFGNKQKHQIISKGILNKKSVGIAYKSEGKKTLVFIAIFKDGSSKTTQSTIDIRIVNLQNLQKTSSCIGNRCKIISDYSFQGYEENYPIYGELEYEIFYHKVNNVEQKTLLNPILFIDGFDPGDKRKILDTEMTTEDLEAGGKSLEASMVYGHNNEKIIPLLQELGYDVILVNHPVYEIPGGRVGSPRLVDGGADYIERNAMNHITLYQHLNSELAKNGSSNEMVIIGPSMGGQVSRYALAYMEKKFAETGDTKWKHNTRLWVSLDSPHQGANIPMGAQANIYFLGYIHGEQKAVDAFNALKSPAGRQQVIHQYRFGNLTPISFFNQYYTNLKNNGLPNSNGYPQNLRKISIVNGAINKLKNGIEGEEVLDIRGYADVLFFTVRGFINQEWYSKNYGQNNKVFFGEVDEVFTSYSLTTHFTNNFLKGSLDVMPGGTFDTQGVLKNQIVEGLEKQIDDGNLDRISVSTYKANHTFMPTHSTLDTNGFSSWYQPINKNLVCSNQTPFDSYFGENRNTKHISFSESSKNWLFKELAGNEQQPPVSTSPPMDGKENVSTGEYLTYSVEAIDGNTNYNWYFTDGQGGTGTVNIKGWSILVNNGNSVTVKAGYTGTRIVCIVTNPCASNRKSKYVYVEPNDGGGSCDEYLRFSSNPMKSNSSTNKIIIETPCDNENYKTITKRDYTLNIYNQYGVNVYTKTSKKKEFNVSSLNKGFYVVKYQTKKRKNITKKLIIE